MLARQTARLAARAARAAPRRSVNLSALEAKVTSDEGKQELNRLKMALNEAELLKQKFSGAPAAIEPSRVVARIFRNVFRRTVLPRCTHDRPT